MPANRSENKIKVTKLFGGSAALGYMDVKPNMRVKNGIENFWVKTVASGNYTVGLSLASGGTVVKNSHPFDLQIDVTVASGWGWPTTGGSVKIAHGVTWPSGTPNAISSGISYMDGDSIPNTFGR